MASFQELANAAVSLKSNSEEMSQRLTASAQGLDECLDYIVAFAEGSSSGMDAAQALNVAGKSLREAAATMLSMERTCDEFINEISGK